MLQTFRCPATRRPGPGTGTGRHTAPTPALHSLRSHVHHAGSWRPPITKEGSRRSRQASALTAAWNTHITWNPPPPLWRSALLRPTDWPGPDRTGSDQNLQTNTSKKS